jgi:hypothetical protein
MSQAIEEILEGSKVKPTKKKLKEVKTFNSKTGR